MDEKYIDVILEKFKDKLLNMPNAKSGLPQIISYVIHYENSTVVDGFIIHFTDNDKNNNLKG